MAARADMSSRMDGSGRQACGTGDRGRAAAYLARMIPRLIAAFAALLSATVVMGATALAAPVKTPHVVAELVAQTRGVAPGSTLYVALRQRLIPGWHVYWRNPGDSGQPVEIRWTLPGGWRAGEIVWPAPEKDVEGPLTNYVLSGDVLLPVPVQVPASAVAGSVAHLAAHAQWLVCKDVCVPEQGDLALDVPIVAGAPAPGLDGASVTQALAAAPKPVGLEASWSASGSTVRLAATGAELRGLSADAASHAWFFPYDSELIDHAGPQRAARGPYGITLELPQAQTFAKRKPTEIAGVLSLGGGRAYELTARPGALPAAAAGLGPMQPTSWQRGGAAPSPAASGAVALLGAVGLAFAGGLILNLMPCVFPVLSIKAAALARHVASPRAARAEGLAFMAGCAATFVALAALLLAARAAGQAVGWGFQLQSPGVVAALCLIMLGVALNLSGVFEIGVSAQGAGSGLASRAGLVGAFFTGALAVVVAAPCTAPFMAGAIGWAVTQSPPAALAVFLALGLGLAAPFTALSFAPALFKRLPKPGAWMEGLRRLLAFPMYAAAAWLAWVLVLQAGPNGLGLLLTWAVLLALLAWLWGVRQKSGGRWAAGALAAAAAVFVAAVALPLARGGLATEASAQTATAADARGGLPIEPWSPERVAALRAEGRPVFVDFTAAWCVTCQVNERTALAGRGVADAFARTHAAYLKADWTKYDPRITAALSAQARSGVPMYLLYDAHGGEPRILPQILTEGGVVAALDAAARTTT